MAFIVVFCHLWDACWRLLQEGVASGEGGIVMAFVQILTFFCLYTYSSYVVSISLKRFEISFKTVK